MASSALASNQKLTEGYFKVPNSFAENQHLIKLPASRSLALLVFKAESEGNNRHTVSDRHWESWTGFKERQKEYAIKELRELGLDVLGRGDTAKFTWNWNRWREAVQTKERVEYDPKRKERDQAAAAKKVHPDCATGCAKLREMAAKNGGSNQPSALLVMPVAQPVARTVVAPAPETPKSSPSPKPGSLAEKEVTWALTLAAMRTQFASAGVDLLVRLLAVLVSFVRLNLSDYVLAEAVKEAYADSRGRWNSPILLLKTVPEVLKGWKAKGQPMDDPGGPDAYTYLSERKKEPPPDPPERPKKKRAVDYL